MQKLTLAEMETIIRFDRSSGEASIYTADPVMMRKLDKLCREDACINEVRRDEYSRWYKCPKSCVKVFKTRILTDAEREKRALRAKELFASGLAEGRS